MSDAATYDAIVIGGGPGGLTAGLYLARAGKKTLLLEQTLLGGQIVTTDLIENYPGFPQGISGKDLIAQFESQATRFGLEIQFGRVESVADLGAEKEVTVSGFPFRAKVVVLATGIIQKLGIPGEDEYLGRGVSYCATCDGALYRNRAVVLVGSTDWAMEEAHFVARFASPLYLVVGTAGLKPTTDVRRELLDNPSVKVVAGAQPAEILGNAQGVTALRLKEKGKDTTRDLDVEGVFVVSGKKRPGTEFLRGLIELDDEGYAKVGEDCQTSRPGIYAVGDVRRKRFHQVATAVGDGCIAGMDALRLFRASAGSSE